MSEEPKNWSLTGILSVALAVVAGVVAFLAVRSRSSSSSSSSLQKDSPDSTRSLQLHTRSPPIKADSTATPEAGSSGLISRESEHTEPPATRVPLAGVGAPAGAPDDDSTTNKSSVPAPDDIPTHDKDGNPLSKKELKRLRKAAMEEKLKREGVTKKPKLSKAERRAMQEKQRAEKAAKRPTLRKPKAVQQKPRIQHDEPNKVKQFEQNMAFQKEREEDKRVKIFRHLPQYRQDFSISRHVGFSAVRGKIHPSVVRLGLKFAHRSITGSDARCAAMLAAFKDFVQDYELTPGKQIRFDMEAQLSTHIKYLEDCRPKSVSMGNAIAHLKSCIQSVDPAQPPETGKALLVEAIDDFIETRISVPIDVIANTGLQEIGDGDVILTYSSSHVVEIMLKKANRYYDNIRVVVADGRPSGPGKDLLERLVACNVTCSYVLLNGVPNVIKDVTKVFMGADCVFSNGTVLNTCGAAMVGMLAREQNIPVAVCCESYKFSDRVQINSIVYNELADPEELVKLPPGNNTTLADWRSIDKLKLLNLTYDLMPREFVDSIVTEFGVFPAASVPEVLRQFRKSGSV